LDIAALGLTQHFDGVVRCLLSDQSDLVRQRAAWVLDNLNDRRAILTLLQAIHDPSWGVRSAAGRGLVHLGEIARPEIEGIFVDSKNEDAREMAQLMLQRL